MTLFAWALRTSGQTAVVVLLMLGVQAVMGRRLRARARYARWEGEFPPRAEFVPPGRSPRRVRMSAMDTMDAGHPNDITLAAFQRHICDRYEATDRARGTPKTFMWFVEEVGELATALNGDDRANLEEEFADVLAWLCTLANINDVDLAGAVARKYLGDKPPEGVKGM